MGYTYAMLAAESDPAEKNVLVECWLIPKEFTFPMCALITNAGFKVANPVSCADMIVRLECM
jgi:hypothetical protein